MTTKEHIIDLYANLKALAAAIEDEQPSRRKEVARNICRYIQQDLRVIFFEYGIQKSELGE